MLYYSRFLSLYQEKKELSLIPKNSDIFTTPDAPTPLPEQVEARNQLDGLIFTVEKTLKDNADKISEEDKAKLEEAVSKAKTELDSGDFERIKAATEALSNEAQTVFAKLYQNGANGSDDPGAGGGAGDTEFHQG